MVSEYTFGHVTGHSSLYFFSNGFSFGEKREKKRNVSLSFPVSFYPA